jgi:hypothetical protein
LDLAIDAVLATANASEDRKFRWTAETTVAVDDWWQVADPQRRDEFLRAVRSGQLEVAALPHNQTPTLDRRQWHTMLHWLPEGLWKQLKPQTAVQNDVNGFPRAGAVALLDRGIRYLFTGINEDSGGVPFRRPAAFWWKMPDGRKMLVYLNYSYPAGYGFFEKQEWRRGPVPRAADTRYRMPRAGDIFKSDETSVREAHQRLLARLKGLKSQGYGYPVLALSVTNQWRIDNDPPLPALAEFVATWKRLQLQPTLRLATVSEAMKRLEAEVGPSLPTYEGEWTDWWANGAASGPREVAASRLAKRLRNAALSPLWGNADTRVLAALDTIDKDLCLFDEHTWGSGDSVAFPYTLDTLGQYVEKSSFAYRAMARAEWLLAQRVRTRLVREPEGLYVANTTEMSWSGWIELRATALREPYQSVVDTASNRTQPLEFLPGPRPFTRPKNPDELSVENTAATFPDRAAGQTARFWIDKLPGNTIRKLQLSRAQAAAERLSPGPNVRLDDQGWPYSLRWPGMTKPLILPGFGDFSAVSVKGFAPRWISKDIWAIADEGKRDRARQENLVETTAKASDKATAETTPHTVAYRQSLQHPRLLWANRTLEVWKAEPRVRFTLRLNRISSEAPEAFWITFPLPCEGRLPRASNGGLPFVPFEDQLPGTCRDYMSVDSWVRYDTPAGSWLWATRDAPLVSFGTQPLLSRRQNTPADTHRLLAMVFNNFWYTNFVADSNGVMEFQFDLVWRNRIDGPAVAQQLADTLLCEPALLLNPALRENDAVIERVYRP